MPRKLRNKPLLRQKNIRKLRLRLSWTKKLQNLQKKQREEFVKQAEEKQKKEEDEKKKEQKIQ